MEQLYNLFSIAHTYTFALITIPEDNDLLVVKSATRVDGSCEHGSNLEHAQLHSNAEFEHSQQLQAYTEKLTGCT